MSVGSKAKRLARRALSLSRSPSIVEAFLTRRSGRGPASGTRHVLIAPPGGGNIGDQAMVEAFVEGVSGPVTVVVRHESSFVGLRDLGDVVVVPLPDLLYGRFPSNLRAAQSLARVLETATSVSVVGADIMDGAYDWQSAVTRSNVAKRAARAGLSTRVIGFSWNSSPHPRALHAVREAAAAGTRLLARDPRSEQRLRDSSVSNVVGVADIVFNSTATAENVNVLDLLPSSDRPIVLLNASGLVGRRIEQTSAYVHLTEDLVRRGYDVVLLPHVIRSGGDDLAECRAVFDALSPKDAKNVVLVEQLLRPREVRALASKAAFVVTGRMHLAVIALSQGVPAAVISTQGKVDGLMEAFDIPDLVVQPEAIQSGALLAIGESLHESLDQLRETVAQRLPAVKRKSAMNFDGLR